jgi:hypothetical protein
LSVEGSRDMKAYLLSTQAFMEREREICWVHAESPVTSVHASSSASPHLIFAWGDVPRKSMKARHRPFAQALTLLNGPGAVGVPAGTRQGRSGGGPGPGRGEGGEVVSQHRGRAAPEELLPHAHVPRRLHWVLIGRWGRGGCKRESERVRE